MLHDQWFFVQSNVLIYWEKGENARALAACID